MMHVYQYESEVDASPAEVFAWHERPGAFERLSPPWADVRVVERTGGGIVDGARVVIEVHMGPLHATGELVHRGYQEGVEFQDEQVRGPFKSYLHTHRFLPTATGGCRVQDEVRWEAPAGPAADLLAGPVVEREISRLFPFRHARLRSDLALHARYRSLPRLTVAISGANGFIGSALRHFLTSGGHRVVPMVRTRGDGGEGAVHWNWQSGDIDRQALSKLDAVVHLAGEPLIGLRWTAEKQREILESRAIGTELIARTMSELHGGPSVLISGSAVGYYGDRGDEVLTEQSTSGRGFLAEVCRAWEEATKRAEGGGIRVVRLRTGFVLSPAGGALAKLVTPFKLGMGGRVGSGRQYLPWIDLDDAVGLIYHALMSKHVRGALNLTAPTPVPQETFASTLGRVLKRPTVVPLPGLAVRALLGQMGVETLLYGQRAKPASGLESGYAFLYEGLEESLRHQLGRAESSADADA